jgi:hypothetical protein
MRKIVVISTFYSTMLIIWSPESLMDTWVLIINVGKYSWVPEKKVLVSTTHSFRWFAARLYFSQLTYSQDCNWALTVTDAGFLSLIAGHCADALVCVFMHRYKYFRYGCNGALVRVLQVAFGVVYHLLYIIHTLLHNA